MKKIEDNKINNVSKIKDTIILILVFILIIMSMIFSFLMENHIKKQNNNIQNNIITTTTEDVTTVNANEKQEYDLASINGYDIKVYSTYLNNYDDVYETGLDFDIKFYYNGELVNQVDNSGVYGYIFYKQGYNYIVVEPRKDLYTNEETVENIIYIYDYKGKDVYEYSNISNIKQVSNGYLLVSTNRFYESNSKFEDNISGLIHYSKGNVYYIDKDLNETTIDADPEINCYESCNITDSNLFMKNNKLVTYDYEKKKFIDVKVNDYYKLSIDNSNSCIYYDGMFNTSYEYSLPESLCKDGTPNYYIRWNSDGTFDVIDKNNNILIKNFFSTKYLSSDLKTPYGLMFNNDTNIITIKTCDKASDSGTIINFMCDGVTKYFKYDKENNTISEAEE